MEKLSTERIVTYIVAGIFLIAGIFFTIRGHAHEYQFDHYAALTPEQGRFYRNKKQYHQDEAIKAYERAHEKCWWIPRISDRTIGRSCFVSVMTTVTAPTPQSKVMAAIVNLMVTYGLAAMDEWDYINYNLMDASHHFELMEFYNDILNRA